MLFEINQKPGTKRPGNVTGWPTQQKNRKQTPAAGKMLSRPVLKPPSTSARPSLQKGFYRQGAAKVPYVFKQPLAFAHTIQNTRSSFPNPVPAANSQNTWYKPAPHPNVGIPDDDMPVIVPGLHPNPYVTPEVPPVKERCSCSTVTITGARLTHFATASSVLTTNHHKQLDVLANIIIQEQANIVVCTGHTDSDGTEDNNMALGRFRAINVINALLPKLHKLKPWSPNFIYFKIASKGESAPVSDKDKALNRRVDVSLWRNECI